MKYIWELEDLKAGMYFGLPENNATRDFLITRTYKLGFCQECRREDQINKGYCQIALTDGAIYGHGSPEEIIKGLNDNGYVPLSLEDVVWRLTGTELKK